MADSATLPPGPSLRDWPDWPEYGLSDDLLPVLERWVAANKRFALATLVEIIGSSPRPVGSEMAVAEDGECVGYVSGGCVEAAVAAEAQAVLASGEPRLLDYGAGSPVVDVQLGCGGRIRILVRELADARAYVEQLRSAREQRRPVTVATEWDLPQHADNCELPLQGVYLKQHLPLTRLIVIGSDPVTLALSRLAPALGMEVLLLRPNGPEQAPPSADLLRYDRRPIQTALAELELDPWCALFTLTHDAETDHAVLAAALRSPAFCVGALGSRRRAEERRLRLLEAGLDEASVARLRSPAGLDLGGHSPQEIALSILGQIVAERPR